MHKNKQQTNLILHLALAGKSQASTSLPPRRRGVANLVPGLGEAADVAGAVSNSRINNSIKAQDSSNRSLSIVHIGPAT